MEYRMVMLMFVRKKDRLRRYCLRVGLEIGRVKRRKGRGRRKRRRKGG